MSVIHQTTLKPGKLELVAPWLPTQPWYAGTSREPELTKAGGFRLDDPRGEVGIEFMVVADGAYFYQVPLTYRGTPLDGADHALIGTAEHGVLGRRWCYDGTHDPVLVAQLLALLQGQVEAQAQSTNDTPDPSVSRYFSSAGISSVVGPTAVANGPDGTDLVVVTDPAGPLAIRVTRVLGSEQAAAEVRGHVTAGWRLPGGGEGRDRFVVVSETAV